MHRTATMSTEPFTTSVNEEHDEDEILGAQSDEDQHDVEDSGKTAVENEDTVMMPVDGENDDKNTKEVAEEAKKAEKKEKEEHQLEESRTFRWLMRCKCCARVLSAFPRTFALFLGVVIPLFCLIFVSMLFGNVLSKLEGPQEIGSNDAILAAQMQGRIFSFVMVQSSVLIPPKCTELFLGQEHHDNIGDELRSAIAGMAGALEVALALDKDDLGGQPSDAVLTVNETVFANETISIRHDELFSFMKSCGESARNVSQTFFNSVSDAVHNSSGDLTFNWIRCYDGAHDLSYHDSFQPANPEYLPDAQENFYTETWRSDQQRLFLQYLNESLDFSNMTVNNTDATIKAFNDSIRDATGGSRCNTNGPSGAWFWFTIMTTVGYGNQSPKTKPGAIMVFTLGFISILAFGGVLAASGYIVSRIFDDAVNRANELKFLSWPWVACFIWGTAYYTWMILIAFHTTEWKNKRLQDESFTMGQGYWFSYISTTSVGLGDIYLEPEVLIGEDLIVFPLLFLTGFTFLSAFLGKFSEAIVSLLRGQNKGLVETLLDQMDQTQNSPASTATRTETAQQGDSSFDETETGKTKSMTVAC